MGEPRNTTASAPQSTRSSEVRTPVAHSIRRRLWLVLVLALVVAVPAIGFTLRTEHRLLPTLLLTQPTPTGAPSTPPDATFAAVHFPEEPVDPRFASYYESTGGANRLGVAITAALPTTAGWVQFFSAGALLLPVRGGQPGAAPADAVLHQASQSAGTSMAVREVPLLSALLEAGSLVPVVEGASTLTYASLRAATLPEAEIAASSVPAGAGGTFIARETRAGVAMGHQVPAVLWSYLLRSDVSPAGWQASFGPPLTEALAVAVPRAGGTHRLLVQLFARGGLVADLDVTDAQGAPQVVPLAIGQDFLHAFGPPTVQLATRTTLWLTGDAAILTTPSAQTAAVHLGLGTALTTQGSTYWQQGVLWYGVAWKTPQRSGTGWVAAQNTTPTAPPKGTIPQAGIDALSPALAQVLGSQSDPLGVAVYDVSGQQWYGSNAQQQFTAASSMKLLLLLTYLDAAEQQGRALTDTEVTQLSAMIEQSDNDATQALYMALGGPSPIEGFLQRIHVPGFAPNVDAWGFSRISPEGMVQLLARLNDGSILTAEHRQFALQLLQNVEADQRIGVGDTAPNGATVAMKDGYVLADDTSWALNTSGIVTVAGKTYIVAVFSEHVADWNAGWDLLRQVCGGVAQALG